MASIRNSSKSSSKSSGQKSGKKPTPSTRRAGQASTSILNRPLGELITLRRSRGSAVDQRIERPDFAPALPSVNLLPDSIRQGIAVTKIRKVAAAAVVLLMIAGGGLWWMQGQQIDQALAQRDAVVATGVQLRAKVQALSPIQAMVTQLENQQELVRTALAAQPQASAVITRLVEAGQQGADQGIAFDSISVTYYPIPGPGGTLNPCPDPDPFGTEVAIGCLTFTARAVERDQVAALLRAMEADPLFVGPYVSNTTVAALADGQSVTFSGSAGISPDGLQTPLSDEQIQAILTPPTPSASASPTAANP